MEQALNNTEFESYTTTDKQLIPYPEKVTLQKNIYGKLTTNTGKQYIEKSLSDQKKTFRTL